MSLYLDFMTFVRVHFIRERKFRPEISCYLPLKVLDIDNIDLAMGKMMEQGPVLVITFNSQQILCVRDRTGKVIEGSPDKVR